MPSFIHDSFPMRLYRITAKKQTTRTTYLSVKANVDMTIRIRRCYRRSINSLWFYRWDWNVEETATVTGQQTQRYQQMQYVTQCTGET